MESLELPIIPQQVMLLFTPTGLSICSPMLLFICLFIVKQGLILAQASLELMPMLTLQL